MKISTVDLVKNLEKLLLQYPSLVNKLKNKDVDLIQQLEKWILEVENLLTKNNIAKVSELAGLRSKILAPNYSTGQRTSIKKLQFQVASEILYDIQKNVANTLLPYEVKVNEAKDIIIQLLMILSQSGTIKFVNTNFQNFILQIWSIFSSTEQLKPSVGKILTLVSYSDALRIISEEINLELFK